jgi:hypothetical protein
VLEFGGQSFYIGACQRLFSEKADESAQNGFGGPFFFEAFSFLTSSKVIEPVGKSNGQILL